MDLLKRAEELHHIPEPHYNCAQATLMRRGSVCGAVTGGLMALGLRGADSHTAAEFQRLFKERTGALDCAQLLQNAKERGEERKAHCDRMVLTAVELVEELTGEKKN